MIPHAQRRSNEMMQFLSYNVWWNPEKNELLSKEVPGTTTII